MDVVHEFEGRSDRPCEVCRLPDRNPIHKVQRKGLRMPCRCGHPHHPNVIGEACIAKEERSYEDMVHQLTGLLVRARLSGVHCIELNIIAAAIDTPLEKIDEFILEMQKHMVEESPDG